MDKLKMHSPDLTQENIAKIRALFPGCVTEAADGSGRVRLVLDFDQLRQELSDGIVEGPQERYRLDWPGKREALVVANAPIGHTLRPCREESVAFETTKNLFVEGDNLEALKLLQNAYLGKIRMIYIDPPYNTGGDFVYEDDFTVGPDEFLVRSLQRDENRNRLVANTLSNGRFHSDWLTMMYPRLKLAQRMLADDGVIFISIGDDELHNLKSICDEVFGRENFVLTFSRMMKSGGAKGRFYTPSIDYILTYAKDRTFTKPFRVRLTQEQIDRFYVNQQDSGSRAGERFGEDRLFKASLAPRPNQRYYIRCPDGTYAIPPGVSFPKIVKEGSKIAPTPEDKVWKWTYERYRQEFELGNIVFKRTTTTALVTPDGERSSWNIYNKLWLKDQQEKGAVPSNFIGKFENRQSSAELKQLGIPFDFAKPTTLIQYLMQLSGVRAGDIVMDFFAGSGSTAHASMAYAASEGRSIRSILVQLPECCGEKTVARKLGFETIADIAKERIRRAGAKIRMGDSRMGWDGDVGFRVLKVDTSNMQDVYYRPDEVTQTELLTAVENIKPDRTAEDLLFQVLVDWGVDLTLPIRHETVQGKTVFFVDENALAACFDTGISEEFVKELAGHEPLRVVFRDTGFVSDAVKINVEQIFRQLSPTTEVRAI